MSEGKVTSSSYEGPSNSSFRLSITHWSLLTHRGLQCPSYGKTEAWYRSIFFNVTIVLFAERIV